MAQGELLNRNAKGMLLRTGQSRLSLFPPAPISLKMTPRASGSAVGTTVRATPVLALASGGCSCEEMCVVGGRSTVDKGGQPDTVNSGRERSLAEYSGLVQFCVETRFQFKKCPYKAGSPPSIWLLAEL